MPRHNKKQHKVPATYLHGFTNSENRIWIADQNFKIYSQKPENVLTENDYYTVKFPHSGGTLSIETKFLNGIESTYARIYRDKLAKQLPITIEDKAELSIFVSCMFDRVSNRRDSLEKFFKEIKEKTEHMRALPDNVKKSLASFPTSNSQNSIPAEDLLKIGEDVPSFHSSGIPETVAFMAPIIFNMNWIFIKDESASFLTSDDPCTMVNPYLEKHYGRGTFYSSPGLAQKDVEITLPFSSSLSLLCGWLLESDLEYSVSTEAEVKDINNRTMRGAKIVISKDQKQLEKLVEAAKARHQK